MPQPIWSAIASTQPDLFLFLGDNVYADWHGEQVFSPTRRSLKDDYTRLAAEPHFSAFRDQVPIMATWDNHDYGTHDGGAKSGFKQTAREVFFEFFGEPLDSPRRERDGIYDSRVFGPEGKRVQVVVLDNRWNRDPLTPDTRPERDRKAAGVFGSMGHTPNVHPSAVLLGEAQWTWLEEQLRLPAEVRLIASGTQIVPDQKGMQEWGNFPHERKRLFDLIEKTGAHGVILLSGNVHYAEVSRTDAGPYPLYEFTSSGMTHFSTTYPGAQNRYRVGDPLVDQNFGLIEIHWDASQGPMVKLQGLNVDGEIGIEVQVPLKELG